MNAEPKPLTGRAGRAAAVLLGPMMAGDWAGPGGVRDRDEAERALLVWSERRDALLADRPASRADRRTKAGRDWETALNVAEELVDEFETGLASGRWGAE